jgi:hypothetical protein
MTSRYLVPIQQQQQVQEVKINKASSMGVNKGNKQHKNMPKMRRLTTVCVCVWVHQSCQWWFILTLVYLMAVSTTIAPLSDYVDENWNICNHCSDEVGIGRLTTNSSTHLIDGAYQNRRIWPKTCNGCDFGQLACGTLWFQEVKHGLGSASL